MGWFGTLYQGIVLVVACLGNSVLAQVMVWSNRLNSWSRGFLGQLLLKFLLSKNMKDSLSPTGCVFLELYLARNKTKCQKLNYIIGLNCMIEKTTLVHKL